MRRSFASNYYGKIETPLLMNITGHTKESTFLTYIGTHQNKDALADLFMQAGRSYLVGSGSDSRSSFFSFNFSKVNLSRTDFVFGKI